jgi:hypothetical protein
VLIVVLKWEVLQLVCLCACPPESKRVLPFYIQGSELTLFPLQRERGSLSSLSGPLLVVIARSSIFGHSTTRCSPVLAIGSWLTSLWRCMAGAMAQARDSTDTTWFSFVFVGSVLSFRACGLAHSIWCPVLSFLPCRPL